MGLEIMLSQTQKDKCHIFSYMWNTDLKCTHTYLYVYICQESKMRKDLVRNGE